MILDITSVESTGAGYRPRGSLVVALVDNDPTKSDGAAARITF
jgi:hypothetical protein